MSAARSSYNLVSDSSLIKIHRQAPLPPSRDLSCSSPDLPIWNGLAKAQGPNAWAMRSLGNLREEGRGLLEGEVKLQTVCAGLWKPLEFRLNVWLQQTFNPRLHWKNPICPKQGIRRMRRRCHVKGATENSLWSRMRKLFKFGEEEHFKGNLKV